MTPYFLYLGEVRAYAKSTTRCFTKARHNVSQADLSERDFALGKMIFQIRSVLGGLVARLGVP